MVEHILEAKLASPTITIVPVTSTMEEAKKEASIARDIFLAGKERKP